MIDTGRVDAYAANPSSRNEPIRRRGIQTGKMEIRNTRPAGFSRPQIFAAIGPVTTETRVNQHNAILERCVVPLLPRRKILDGNLIIAVRGAFWRYVDTCAVPNKSL